MKWRPGQFGGAILGRELASVARRGASYAQRSLFVAVLSVIVVSAWASTHRGAGPVSYAQLSSVGSGLFHALFGTEIVLVSLLGPLVTGGVIAQERRQRTLELLFMTPMSDTAIVFAKYLARMAHLLGVVLLGAPVLLACLAFGGVDPYDILVGTVLVLVCGAWSGALGLLASAMSEREYHGVMRGLALLLAQAAGLPMVLSLLGALDVWRVPPWTILLTSPQAYAFARVLGEDVTRVGGEDVWAWVAAGVAACSCLVVLGSVWFLRRSAPAGAVAERAAGDTRVRRRVAVPRSLRETLVLGVVTLLFVGVLGLMLYHAPGALEKSFGLAGYPLAVALGAFWYFLRGGRRSAGDGPGVWDNPVAWKEVALGRTRAQARRVGLGLLLLSGLMYLFLGGETRAWKESGFHGGFLGFETLVMAVVTIALAAPTFAHEAESGRLDLLLTTPLSPWRIVAGKERGILAVLAPFLLFAAGHLCVSLTPGTEVDLHRALMVVPLVLGYLFFFSSLGMLLSLGTRRTAVAMGVCLGGGIALYMLVPIVISILLRHRDDGFLMISLLYLIPVVGPTVTLTDSAWRGSKQGAMALGYAFTLAVYFGGGAYFRARLLAGFDRLARRCR